MKDGMECKDAIRTQLGKEGYLAWCRGCVIKYIWRYEDKGGLEDLRKARDYIEEMLKEEA